MKSAEKQGKKSTLSNNTASPALLGIQFTTSAVTSHSPFSLLVQCRFVLYLALLCFDNQDIVFNSYSSWALRTVVKYFVCELLRYKGRHASPPR